MAIRTFEFTAPEKLRSSPTMSAAALATKAQGYGLSVDVFTLGDLFPKPKEEEIARWKAKLDAEKAAALRPVTRKRAYSETAGIPSLRDTIAETFTRDTGMEAKAADVRVGNGGKGALTGAFYFLVEQPATVLVAAPGWPTNYDMFPAGTKIVEVDTNGRGLMSPAELGEALSKYAEPSVLLINAPNNPTGANYAPEEREALLQVVKQKTKTTLVAFDDPYGKLVFDRAPYDIRTVLQRGPVEKELFAAARIAVFRTASKEYGMADSRTGWVVTKHARMLQSLQDYNESKGGGMSVRNQEEVQAALLYGDDFIIRTQAELMEKRALVMEQVDKLSYATMEAPQGTIYTWIDFAGLKDRFVPAEAIASDKARSDILSDTERNAGGFTIASPDDMMRYLVYVAGICPVQGTPFYAPGSPAAKTDWHVRFSFCSETEQLKRGLANLQRAEALLATRKAA